MKKAKREARLTLQQLESAYNVHQQDIPSSHPDCGTVVCANRLRKYFHIPAGNKRAVLVLTPYRRADSYEVISHPGQIVELRAPSGTHDVREWPDPDVARWAEQALADWGRAFVSLDLLS